ncbi:Signal transduction histidine kinase [Bifidobacterium goeldii]|uniref:Signal transduction histidine kinase n=1 Tax=Bifidobacterium goeldii TaxID=2306975 RepID=A0A430FKN7_9BIFI|nr:hypothetical protein [Bifidobacterium goeldii]RSX53463.1 Signal transduction histidine kinase [Bifidobacterium goeldii]
MARNDKLLLADGRTRALLACSSLPAIIETVYLYSQGNLGDTGILFAMLSVCACLLMSLAPRIGGWTIVLLWVVHCVIPQTTAFSLLFCLLMAITVMAYLRIGSALAASVMAEAAAASRIWLYPWDSAVITTVCATAAFLMVALWIGSSMSWQERHEREERERAVLLRRLADQQLAAQLHHSVANDLTTILLLARQLEPTCSDDDSVSNDDNARDGSDVASIASIVSLIVQSAQDSLVKVRTLIAGLDGSSSSPSGAVSDAGNAVIDGNVGEHENASTAGADHGAEHRNDYGYAAPLDLLTADELRELADRYHARLYAQGLDGDIIIGGLVRCSCTAARKSALLDVLHEIVGNMMKYADATAGYCIVVTLEAGLATLSSSNGMRNAEPAADAEAASSTKLAASTESPTHTKSAAYAQSVLSGGTGLVRCRTTAESLGGEFTVDSTGSTWTTLLKLPLT